MHDYDALPKDVGGGVPSTLPDGSGHGTYTLPVGIMEMSLDREQKIRAKAGVMFKFASIYDRVFSDIAAGKYK